MYFFQSVCCLIFISVLSPVNSHGYLYDPPSRSTMWRHGFNVEANYDDNALYCGGKEIQWGLHGGKCGVCGDRYDGPRHNEAGGKYASGIISRTYTQGSVLPIIVVLTAPHGGWFEFRLCPNNDVTKPATQECLDMHLLGLAGDPNVKRFSGVSSISRYELDYQLPPTVTCQQCVLQWKYNTGKDWGCRPGTNICAIGLGPQEQFYGCADIAISPRDGSGFTTKTTTTPKTTRKTTSQPTTTTPKPTTASRVTSTTPKPTTPTPKPSTVTARKTTRQTMTLPTKKDTTTTTTTTTKSAELRDCKGAGVFKGTYMDDRCRYTCRMGSCPKILCSDACRVYFAEFL